MTSSVIGIDGQFTQQIDPEREEKSLFSFQHFIHKQEESTRLQLPARDLLPHKDCYFMLNRTRRIEVLVEAPYF
jgi:hypothetical protein